MNTIADPRLILREDELDLGLELLLLAEAALWAAVDTALETEASPGKSGRLGRPHWRAAFLLRRRPNMGVRELAKLTGYSKQAASRTLAELERAGLVEKSAAELDARRRPARLTAEGEAFETRISERLRGLIARAYRDGGLDGVGPARRILASLAGPRLNVGLRREETP